MNVRGISRSDVALLCTYGFHDLTKLAQCSANDLSLKIGVDINRALFLLEKTYQRLEEPTFSLASSLLLKQRGTWKISTGSLKIDALLGGGIQLGEVTVISGYGGSGKSQLGYTVSVIAQLPVEKGGGAGRCMVYFTDNSYRPERVVEVCHRFGVDEKYIMDRIKFARLFNSNNLMGVMEKSDTDFSENWYSLLIVDCLGQLIRTEVTDKSRFSFRHQMTSEVMKKLRSIAEKFNLAVLVLNVVYPNFNFNFWNKNYVLPYVPFGCSAIESNSICRAMILKGKDNTQQEQRTFQLLSSPEKQASSCIFYIKSGGVCDT